MARKRKRPRGKMSPNANRLLKDEQGDLLAETLSKVLSGPEGDSEVEGTIAAEGDQIEEVAREGNPGAEVDGISDNEPDEERKDGNEEFIPDTPWEQKMAWAKERVQDGLRAEALGLYRELVDEQPSSVRALNNLGILLDEMGEHQEAVLQLEHALELDPANLEVAGNLGAALGAMGKYVEAEELLRRVLRHDSNYPGARANLGILFYRRGLYEQAETELASVCQDQPEHGLAFYYRGEALNRLGRVDEAMEALERTLEILPGNSRACYTLGILFDKKNLPEEAAAMYRKARELSRG